MREKIGRILNGQIATSLIYILLGICLIAMPVDMVNILCRIIFGVVLIVAGLYHIWIYVQEKTNATLLDLFSGGLILVLGIYLFYSPQVVVQLLPILLGTFILTDSIWVLKGSRKLRKKDSGCLEWKILLIGSAFFVGFGIVMIVNPFPVVRTMVIFAGGILVANGVADFIFLFLMRKGIRTLTKLREKVKTKEECVTVEEPGKPEPAYAPWSSRDSAEEPAYSEEEKSGIPDIDESTESSKEVPVIEAEDSDN